MSRKPKLLWVGDACCASGFERATRYTLATLYKYYEIVVLGLNYHGDPHSFPYQIFPASLGGDAFGVKRVGPMVQAWKPDVVVIQNDPWNVKSYTDEIRLVDKKVAIVGTIAVDGLNCRGDEMQELDLALFWTEFGRDEAVKGGYAGPTGVVPLGVDLETYYPRERSVVQKMFDSRVDLSDAFLVGNVNRNQPRKRLDLTIKAFAEWVALHQIDNAYLYLHVCPTGDSGYDVRKLMKFWSRYYGAEARLKDKLLLAQPPVGYGIPEEGVACTYNLFDVQLNTGQGEGFGLTTLEGMASGVLQIAGDWAALGSRGGWAEDALLRIPCISTAATLGTANGFIDVIGGVIDTNELVKALQRAYSLAEVRARFGSRGIALANRPRFRWENVGELFAAEVAGALGLAKEELLSA